jgi:hypothetical protein
MLERSRPSIALAVVALALARSARASEPNDNSQSRELTYVPFDVTLYPPVNVFHPKHKAVVGFALNVVYGETDLVYGLNVNAIAGESGAVYGIELGLLDAAKRFGGLQVNGILGHAEERFDGIQITGIYGGNGGTFRGLQLSGIVASITDGKPALQTGLLLNRADSLVGSQIGLIQPIASQKARACASCVRAAESGAHPLGM